MKKILLVLVLAAIIAGGAFADWYDEYAPGIEGATFFINAGIGFGILPYKMSLPPISASIEYALQNIPLSIGGYFGITGYKEDFLVADYKGTMMGFGAKASYHFNFARNFDPYVCVVLGYLIWKEEISNASESSIEADQSTLYYATNVGARYFFTRNIGAYAEIGYSAVSVVSAGLALKF